MRFYATTVLSFIAALPLTAQSADLNSVELGSRPDIATLHAKLGIDVVPGLWLQAGRYSGRMTLAGCPVLTHITVDADNRIQVIEVAFPPSCFDDYAKAGNMKWGTPTSSGSAHLSNAFGSQVDAIEHDWKTTDATIALTSCDPLLSNQLHTLLGSLTLTTKAKSDADAARTARAAGNF